MEGRYTCSLAEDEQVLAAHEKALAAGKASPLAPRLLAALYARLPEKRSLAWLRQWVGSDKGGEGEQALAVQPRETWQARAEALVPKRQLADGEAAGKQSAAAAASKPKKVDVVQQRQQGQQQQGHGQAEEVGAASSTTQQVAMGSSTGSKRVRDESTPPARKRVKVAPTCGGAAVAVAAAAAASGQGAKAKTSTAAAAAFSFGFSL